MTEQENESIAAYTNSLEISIKRANSFNRNTRSLASRFEIHKRDAIPLL